MNLDVNVPHGGEWHEGRGWHETVQVTDTQSKLSTARIIRLLVPSTDLMKDDFIVRPKLTLKSNAKAKKNKLIKQIEKDIDREMDKEFEKND